MGGKNWMNTNFFSFHKGQVWEEFLINVKHFMLFVTSNRTQNGLYGPHYEWTSQNFETISCWSFIFLKVVYRYLQYFIVCLKNNKWTLIQCRIFVWYSSIKRGLIDCLEQSFGLLKNEIIKLSMYVIYSQCMVAKTRDNLLVDMLRRVSTNSVSANKLKIFISFRFASLDWKMIFRTALSVSTFKFLGSYLTTLCKM